MTVKIIELDALVVGAGFGGVYQLKRLRDEGFNVKLIESGSDYGGVWYVSWMVNLRTTHRLCKADLQQRYWNRYPGARVDSTIPHYEFSDPELFTEWSWTQRFPGSAELRSYFHYVAEKWNLRKDTVFSTLVTGAVWSETSSRWTIYTNTDTIYSCQFFLPNIGFAAKRHTPDWKGIDTFQGTWIHPSYWPKDEPDLRGKKIAVIGTGSTGVQLTQALAPIAGEFVLFQRTPNTALPMKQVEFDGHSVQATPREEYAELFQGRGKSFGGFDFNFMDKNTFDDSEEDRKKTYEDLWGHGDFHYWLATYQDMLFDDRANTEAYNFWYVSRWSHKAALHMG